MKKTFICILLIFILTAAPSLVKASDRFVGQTLTIYNVEDYISNGEDDSVSIIDDFEKKYGVKVNYYTYDTNETMYNQFTLQKEGTYDLVCTSDYMIQKLIKEELVEPMDDFEKSIPNYEKYASKVLRNKLKAMKVPYQNKEVNLDQFAVGYMWGTLGIIYDPLCSDTVREDVKSWDAFWNEKYKNVVSIKNSMRDAYVSGLMHHYSKTEEFKALKDAYLNNNNPVDDLKYQLKIQDIFDFKLDGSKSSENENYEKIAAVKEELISLKKNIFGFEVDSGKNDIITGKIKMNLAYSGDATYSISTAKSEVGKTLEDYVPEDGSNIWYDAWTLPKGSNKELAYLFLNYLSDPVNASANMDYIGYTPYIVGDELFSLASSWYGASDYCSTTDYDEESYVIYDNKLYITLKEISADDEIKITNNEYFSSCEYDKMKTYDEGELLSYNGDIYECLQKSTGIDITNTDYFEKIEPYDLSYLFEGTLTEGRRAIIYPFSESLNQLETQYPSEKVIARCAIMNDFGDYNESVIIMWGQVKAYTNMLPIYIFLIIFLGLVIGLITTYLIKRRLSAKNKRKMMKLNK